MSVFLQTDPFAHDAGFPSARVTLGRNVNRLRTQQGINKKSFALMMNISRPLLDKIEKGESDIRMSYLQRLADGLSVHPFELLTPFAFDDGPDA